MCVLVSIMSLNVNIADLTGRFLRLGVETRELTSRSKLDYIQCDLLLAGE